MLGIELIIEISGLITTKSGFDLTIYAGSRKVNTRAWIAGAITGKYLTGTKKKRGGSNDIDPEFSLVVIGPRFFRDLIPNRSV
jgi:hypothetical protein